MTNTDPVPSNNGDVKTSIVNYDVEAVNASSRSPLYAARQKIHPKRTTGFFRSLKWWIMAATLGVYYLTPWLRWFRGPSAPDQAVLVDIEHRRFYFFFIEIWPQEFFYIAGLLVLAGIGLFLVTSVVGRAWCGYTCPQTVWVDLFLVVERFFEGDRNARIKLDKARWSVGKIRKRFLKHLVWLLISVCTGGAWIFYFADAPTLLGQLLRGDAAFIAYATVVILTATTYVFGGFMREQICTYMCPWPRVQAAMLDTSSLTVTYNDWRGEPRGKHTKRKPLETSVGDCVDCNACVAVCPVGIDIRDGQQLECITCALCIDACDSVMEKMGREIGLISYATWSDYQFNTANTQEPSFQPKTLKPASVLRPRTLIYIAVYCLIGLGLLVSLLTRDHLGLDVAHSRNPLFVQLSDGSVRNGVQLKISNKLHVRRVVEVSVRGLTEAKLKKAGSTDEGTVSLRFTVGPDQTKTEKIFVIMQRANIEETSQPFHIEVTDLFPQTETEAETASAEAWFESRSNK